MRRFHVSPLAMAGNLYRQRNLIKVLSIREIAGRYRGSIFGLLWSFFNPILMLGVYTFVFSVVFNARWGQSSSKAEFALIIFVSLMVFNVFAECVNRASMLVISNANYVKKVVFPLELLPVVNMAAAIFHMLVSLMVWMLAHFIILGAPPLTSLLFPIVILPVVMMTLGLTWFLASLGVYFRDVAQIVTILVTATMFLSPIFYPASALPAEYRDILSLNPIVPTIEMTRAVLIAGSQPDWRSYATNFLASASFSWLGYLWFQKTRKGFADVL